MSDIRYLALLAPLCLLMTSCQDQSSVETCAGACAPNGVCHAFEASLWCECDDGFHQELLACIANDVVNPCLGVTCDERGICRETNGVPRCHCAEGYDWLEGDELHCLPAPGATGDCGDGRCTHGEDAIVCPEDCEAVCGDGVCLLNEGPGSCPEDCAAECGDELCTHDELAATCPEDCVADCGDEACTHDEGPATCPEDCPPVCGDGYCTEGERICSCPADCPESSFALDEETVALWRFEGDALDESENGFDGELIGETDFAEGRFGQAALFDGSGSAVRVPESISWYPGDGVTIEAWVFIESVDGETTQVWSIQNAQELNTYAAGDGWTGAGMMQIHPTEDVKGYIFSPFTLPFDEWHHIALTYDTEVFRLWLDGRLAAETPAVGLPSPSPYHPSGQEGRPAIGANNRLDWNWTDGLIDEFRVSRGARYSPTPGESIAIISGGGLLDDTVHHVAVGERGDLILSGAFYREISFDQRNGTQRTAEALAAADAFVAYYNYEFSLTRLNTVQDGQDGASLDAAIVDAERFVSVGFGKGTPTFEVTDSEDIEFTSTPLDYDGYIVLYHYQRGADWVEHIAGDWVEVQAVDTHEEESILAAGRYRGSAIFGQGTEGHQALGTLGQFDVFVARYDLDGVPQWVRAGRNTGDATVSDLRDARDGGALVGGSFETSLILNDGEPDEMLLEATGAGERLFLARYTPTGALDWAVGGRGEGTSAVGDLDRLQAGWIVGGRFTGELILGEGDAEVTLTAVGGSDGFVARFDDEGTLRWAFAIGAEGDDSVDGVAPLSGTAFAVAGTFTSEALLLGESTPAETTLNNGGGADIFVARYDADAELLWARRDGGAEDDIVNDATTSGAGSIMVVGDYEGTATFGAGTCAERTLTSVDDADVFLMTISP